MIRKESMVHVIARLGVDLVKLSTSNSPMELPCSAIGRIIAQKVLDGNGQALVPLSHIRIATDTTDGVNALLNNFDLIEQKTKRPLLFALIRKQEINS